MVERDREVRRLTAEGEQKEMNHAREMTALKVGPCRSILSKVVLKSHMASPLEAKM